MYRFLSTHLPWGGVFYINGTFFINIRSTGVTAALADSANDITAIPSGSRLEERTFPPIRVKSQGTIAQT